jgi:DNA-binding transcriptional LysR family regulator
VPARARGLRAHGRGAARVRRDAALLASVDAFRGSIDDIHNRMGGQLEVALFDKTATNPKARIGEAIARFTEIAPEVNLAVHVGSINAIEQGVLEGNFQIGIIPAHRSSKSLVYADLFDETMLLYCGKGHPLFDSQPREAHLGEAARASLRGPGLSLAEHGTEPPRKAVAQGDGLRPGGDCDADSFGALPGLSCPTTTRRCSSSAGS